VLFRSWAIVFYAKGKIRTLDLETGSAETIPFAIRDERTMTRALRFPVEVAPDEFDVKMLRWTTVSPDGSRVVFQALGHLYIRDVDGGTPTRITTQSDHFEFYPSFSADGQRFVYSTWDDEELGSIRTISLRTGESHTITTSPGHYITPSFSPDGTHVVAQKVSGGWLTSSLYSNEPGIYMYPVDGGEAERVIKGASAPHFGADADRVYFTRMKSESDADNRSLCSADLSGNEERTHFTSEWATEFRVSPTGEHVAFIERQNVFLASFVRTGSAIKVSPGTKSFPLTKVSSEGEIGRAHV